MSEQSRETERMTVDGFMLGDQLIRRLFEARCLSHHVPEERWDGLWLAFQQWKRQRVANQWSSYMDGFLDRSVDP